jgi:hypothetical protein
MGKNILAVVLGIVVGSAVNMGLIVAGMKVVPPPEGVDVFKNPESLKENIHRFETKHFVAPLLAHALGTLVGAFVAAKTAASHHFQFAMLIGAFFFAGGVYMAYDLAAPIWSEALDLIAAYFPMAWLGCRLAGDRPSSNDS